MLRSFGLWPAGVAKRVACPALASPRFGRARRTENASWVQNPSPPRPMAGWWAPGGLKQRQTIYEMTLKNVSTSTLPMHIALPPWLHRSIVKLRVSSLHRVPSMHQLKLDHDAGVGLSMSMSYVVGGANEDESERAVSATQPEPFAIWFTVELYVGREDSRDMLSKAGKELKRMNRINCQLFDKHADWILPHLDESREEPLIVVLHYFKVICWNGKTSLQSNFHLSKVHINPDLEEVFRDRTTRVLLDILVAPCDTFLKRSRHRPQGIYKGLSKLQRRKSPPRAGASKALYNRNQLRTRRTSSRLYGN
ncbi:hypothetical protein PIB30_006398 [Stylosanthes scabra]|uniref:Uncharacterized protein n=1 Tax=Stylosanthes scabra TaxID=79078 RepID=A0ABU6T420_9FABA|nr:hypothetical protein [Stylosanthes scabra]